MEIIDNKHFRAVELSYGESDMACERWQQLM